MKFKAAAQMRKMTLSKKEVDENEVNEQVDKIIKTCLKAAKDGKRSETIIALLIAF